MKINIFEPAENRSLYPLTCARKLLCCPVGGTTLEKALKNRIQSILPAKKNASFIFSISSGFWASIGILKIIADTQEELAVFSGKTGKYLAWTSKDGKIPAKAKKIPADSESLLICYPWHILTVNEEIIGGIKKNSIGGEIRRGVTIDGKVVIGRGTVLLPGVYIEGNVIIGENCKIGPNCYFRGTTSVGNNCHIGQAVEIKNSIIMNNVSAGHLSYVGDSIIGERANLGAGTITANFRHDGKNHRSMVEGKLVDTGRRKFGAIIGDNVHTGIHTSIYPGRKIWPGMSTKPGEVVTKDIMP